MFFPQDSKMGLSGLPTTTRPPPPPQAIVLLVPRLILPSTEILMNRHQFSTSRASNMIQSSQSSPPHARYGPGSPLSESECLGGTVPCKSWASRSSALTWLTSDFQWFESSQSRLCISQRARATNHNEVNVEYVAAGGNRAGVVIMVGSWWDGGGKQ